MFRFARWWGYTVVVLATVSSNGFSEYDGCTMCRMANGKLLLLLPLVESVKQHVPQATAITERENI